MQPTDSDASTPTGKRHDLVDLLGLGGWPPLGSTFALAVSPRRTVLVGRNGSGKSLIVTGIGHTFESRRESRPPIAGASELPRDFAVGLGRGGKPSLVYASGSGEFLVGFFESMSSNLRHPKLAARLSGAQKCELCIDLDSSRVWAQIHGLLMVSPPERQTGVLGMLVPRTNDVLGVGDPLNEIVADSVTRLTAVFHGTRLVPAGIPRPGSSRTRILLDETGASAVAASPTEDRLLRIARRVRSWTDEMPQVFEALVAFGRRNRLWSTFEVVTYQASRSNRLFAVHADDVNLGFLPDGTLRALELAVELVDPAVRLLLIEEPETAVHPWLLGRLLAEMDAVNDTRQIVVSTHSPIVVDWASPEELRLVERMDGATSVRSLTEQERTRVHDYLNDEGTLAEYIYEQGEV